jgi:thiol-disulfide isomerase/thioredoxin
MSETGTNTTLPKAEFIKPADLPGVLAAHEHVVVDLTGEGWCPWCDMLAPVITKLWWQYPNLHVVKIDSEDVNDLPAEYDVADKGVPHLLSFKNGELVAHGGFDTEYVNMAAWFSTAAGVPNPYIGASFEAEFATTADAACATFQKDVKEKGEPYRQLNVGFEKTWRETKEALEAEHAAGKLTDEELATKLAENDARDKAERTPAIAPFFELRDKAVAAYVAAITEATGVFLDKVAAEKAEAMIPGPVTGGLTTEDADTAPAGSACAIGDKNCKQ